MKRCSKIETCYKIKMILDKDIMDFQYAQAIKDVCSKCPDNDQISDEAIERIYKKLEDEHGKTTQN